VNRDGLIRYNMMIMIAQMQLWWAEMLLKGTIPLPDFPEPNDIYTIGHGSLNPDGTYSHFGIAIKTWRN